MMILMAGLPGSGKSTLARALAERTAGVVLNKDEIRAALFAQADIEYSTAQDDFCVQVMLEASEYLLKKNPQRKIFLDGRTFSRTYQIEHALQKAQSLQQPWHILECICSEETAQKRILEQKIAGQHQARNRDDLLYRQLKSRFEEIVYPKTIVNTDLPLEACIHLSLESIAQVPNPASES